ncbi:50S ribosomal protein L23 [Psychroflexus planctonicus]|uniref:Large ribosomal subunit protein uL23 n=1 Tax=Psychroflexus planctonicus TaxID=1526575 RepID=A0ABQ1SBD0_9FLAO|nr:50S ribosomal protein L23 [Psychroflexus planctonicus]GGE23906.1 50S ribosomal protein L23 [Psychroflexus planctonicus]
MSVLQKPIITEKATANSELQNTYWFEVDINANKLQIKEAVESAYGVTVDSVRTMNVFPKVKSRFTKTGVVSGRKKFTKKAIVKVTEGEIIDLYSNL